MHPLTVVQISYSKRPSLVCQLNDDWLQLESTRLKEQGFGLPIGSTKHRNLTYTSSIFAGNFGYHVSNRSRHDKERG